MRGFTKWLTYHEVKLQLRGCCYLHLRTDGAQGVLSHSESVIHPLTNKGNTQNVISHGRIGHSSNKWQTGLLFSKQEKRFVIHHSEKRCVRLWVMDVCVRRRFVVTQILKKHTPTSQVAHTLISSNSQRNKWKCDLLLPTASASSSCSGDRKGGNFHSYLTPTIQTTSK